MLAIRQTIFLSYVLAIAYLSLLPGDAVQVNIWDKFLHTAAYAAMSLLAAWSLPGKRSYFIALVLLCIYGILLEYGQSFIPDRFPSWQDIIANTLGLAIGAVIPLLSQTKYLSLLSGLFPINSR
jgi:VanZ family protein